jgi:hypothetical protein
MPTPSRRTTRHVKAITSGSARPDPPPAPAPARLNGPKGNA